MRYIAILLMTLFFLYSCAGEAGKQDVRVNAATVSA